MDSYAVSLSTATKQDTMGEGLCRKDPWLLHWRRQMDGDNFGGHGLPLKVESQTGGIYLGLNEKEEQKEDETTSIGFKTKGGPEGL